ncbi:MAG: leucine--tRNA ligase [Chitinophagaceae bacterium]
MEYNFREIEKNWQHQWEKKKLYEVKNHSQKPKYYVLDMFPYPSGSGLHVGHPLGYIASDIYARFKRLKGFNVLHPMGFDAFGLPAEQYAIESGRHPAETTQKNIENFKAQLDNIGFSFDWEREIRTCDPGYYKWTQWIFLEIFNSWYNRKTQKAQPIADLLEIFKKEGNLHQECPGNASLHFSAREWKDWDAQRQEEVLMDYRLAFCGYGEVNWCPGLGTVLANDEVVNGLSERGGFPVVRKKLRQWYLRITEYGDRLLQGLQHIDFSDAMKEMQINWIGKSIGAEIKFALSDHQSDLLVYTTRPDTIFGVDFMVIAPEHEILEKIITPGQRQEMEGYLQFVRSRSERERMTEKKISGCFTGSHAIHPFTGKKIPIWVAEYVLAGYGTGAIMGVPCGDERDHHFAKHFNIPITNIIGGAYQGEEANSTKEVLLENSNFLNGMAMKEAMEVVIQKIEEKKLGRRKVNFKMRDASFSRQRYWGEPFPITWDNGVAQPLPFEELPLQLPHVEHYQPGPNGEGPLANIADWTSKKLETNTMPGYAGSSWYFLRFMDPQNPEEFCSRSASDYWGQVDLYIGGTEHAVGHLLYSRMWTKVLFDLGHISHQEPFKKLVNQGMIQGSSRLAYRLRIPVEELDHRDQELLQRHPVLISLGIRNHFAHGQLSRESLGQLLQQQFPDLKQILEKKHSQLEFFPIPVDVSLVDGQELNIDAFKNWKPEYQNAYFLLEQGKFICESLVEKMSKSKYNTVNPDDIVQKYGADTFRLYEMFLGPVEQSKPWDTQGIEGVHRFLKKFWRLFYDDQKGWLVQPGNPSTEELKLLHRTIKKIEEDAERFSFNTAVSQMMIGVNELTTLKCHNQFILEQFLILLAPFAPHICEELYQKMGHDNSIMNASFPTLEEKFLLEQTFQYPIAVNGKTRTEMIFPTDAQSDIIEKEVLTNEVVIKWLDGKTPKKVIVVKGRMVNIVV